jgi:hypothetical protein
MRLSSVLFSSTIPPQPALPYIISTPNFGLRAFREAEEKEKNIISAPNFMYFLLDHINIRPDSAFREGILKRLIAKPDQPLYIRKLSRGLGFIDRQGWLHWFKFGKRLLEGILTCRLKVKPKTQPQTYVDAGKDFFRQHDVYMIVNRKTKNAEAESIARDGVKAFHIPDPFIREWPTKLQKQDIKEISYVTVKNLATAKGITFEEPNTASGKSNFVYAIVAIKRDKPHPNYIWDRIEIPD